MHALQCGCSFGNQLPSFVPKRNMEKMGMFRNENKVALHCRKVLIDPEPKGLFPEWLRFLKGVVDSSDLPLSVSRETMQDSELLRKLNQVLTKRFLRFWPNKPRRRRNYLEFGRSSGSHQGGNGHRLHLPGRLGQVASFESPLWIAEN